MTREDDHVDEKSKAINDDPFDSIGSSGIREIEEGENSRSDRGARHRWNGSSSE